MTLKLTVVARHMRQAFDRSVEQSGLTRAKWSLIAAVAYRPGGTQRELAEALEVREITVGRLLDKLCAEGYLRRSAHPKDGRAYCVYLAPAAKPVLNILDKLAKTHESLLFADFSKADLDGLEALLDAMARNLAAAGPRRPVKRLVTPV